jgi:hypothetical protein
MLLDGDGHRFTFCRSVCSEPCVRAIARADSCAWNDASSTASSHCPRASSAAAFSSGASASSRVAPSGRAPENRRRRRKSVLTSSFSLRRKEA